MRTIFQQLFTIIMIIVTRDCHNVSLVLIKIVTTIGIIIIDH